MDENIARALRGEATPRELAELEQWRAASPDNERHYQEVAWLLQALRRSAPTLGSPAPRAADLIAGMKRRRHARSRESTRFGKRLWLPLGLAAAAALILVVTRVRMPGHDASQIVADASVPTEIETGAGELATVRMTDGTVARLGPRTRMRLMADRHERVVSVEGHAFFAVAKDSSRPFRVRTHGGDLLALGTRFDVRTEPRGLRLAVLEGRVAIYARGAQAEVGMGEAAGVRDGETISVFKLVNADTVTRWMRRFLAFQETRLTTVALEIERVYGRRVAIADETLGDETVTATFTDDSLEQVLRVVCTVVGVTCRTTDSLVTISR